MPFLYLACVALLFQDGNRCFDDLSLLRGVYSCRWGSFQRRRFAMNVGSLNEGVHKHGANSDSWSNGELTSRLSQILW